MASAAVQKLRDQLKSTKRNARERAEDDKLKFVGWGLGAAAAGGYVDETYPGELMGVSKSEAVGALALAAAFLDFAGDMDVEACGAGVGLLAPQAREFGVDFARKRKK